VDFVDEEHVTLFQTCQHAHQVGGALEGRTGGTDQFAAHLGRHDVCEGGFAEPGWSAEQQVVEWLAPLSRGLERYRQAFALEILTDELFEVARTQRGLNPLVIISGGAPAHHAAVHQRCVRACWARKYSVMMSWMLVMSSRVASS
jgi:hypothetical protein